MPQAAPVTPDTLARIRREADYRAPVEIARDLGWSIGMLCRVASARAIRLPIADAVVQTSTPAQPKPPAVKADAQGHLVITEAMTLDQIVAALPARQGEVLQLLRTEVDGRYLSGAEIACRLGIDCANSNITHLVRKLDAKLKPTCWRIGTRERRGGGYRLYSARGES